VQSEEAIAFAEKHNMAFIETSAYDATRIGTAFETILKGV
jgi:singapore isolate B (sub-type 7) whole genome shotgun sequence assembly, scaffold_5